MSDSQQRPVPLAIVGLACRFPKADDAERYWSNILNGVDCIEDVPESHWRPEDYFSSDPKAADRTYAKRGGFLSPTDFHPLEYGIPPASIEATDTSQLLGMMAAKEALADAGYGPDGKPFDRERVSVILGVTGALELVIPLGARLGHPIWRRALKEAGLDDAQTEAIVQKIADGYVPWQEQSFPGLLGNVVAGRIANHLDLGGSNCVVDAACASSLGAIHLAALELISGRADMALTGGVDTFNDIFMYMCFSKTPALSPSGEARPFAADGDGVLLGEGVGVLALKRLADAERDGDRIYAVIKGIGSSSDGKGNAIYAPSAEGQVKALRRAYQISGVAPRSIQLVEGHGTGTKVGDAVELDALNRVYREAGGNQPWCAVGSVKSQIGHTKAAAGAAGLIKAALALRHKTLPPSIKAESPLAGARGDSPFYLTPQARPWLPAEEHPRRAAVSAFGFGGSNYHCVLEEYGAETDAVVWDGRIQVLAFSAADRAGLQAALAAFPADASWADLAVPAAKSRLAFRSDDPCRLTVVLEEGKSDVATTLKSAATLLEKYGDKPFWSAPEGVFFGSGGQFGKVGVLFPGQGAQYVNMMRDLACRFPQMQRVLADVDKAFAGEEDFAGDRRLSDIIFPPPSYDAETAAAQEARLRDTQNAQPAIGAMSIGAFKTLNYFGFRPDAAAGHSYGEITALCASERFDAQALYLLSRLRGKLMAEGAGDRGAMLAVRAPLERVADIVAEHRLDLTPANKNAPDQIVLSGPTAEIERAATLLDSLGVSNRRLNVAAAFHSSLISQASEPFSLELQKIDFPPAKIPVYANATARPYPESPAAARHLLADQLIKPVEFVEEIRNMHADGVRVFLEVGPGARLTGLVKSILAGEAFAAVAVDASSGGRPGMVDLARALSQLAVMGCPLDLSRWEDSAARIAAAEKRQAKGFAVSLTGANYKDPKTRERAARPVQVKIERPSPPPPSGATVSKPEEFPSVAESAPRAIPQPSPSAPAGAAAPSSPPAAGALSEAMRALQANMTALQEIQRQTADLHRQFLDGQDRAVQNMTALMQQQQSLFCQGSAPAAAPIAMSPPTTPQLAPSAPQVRPNPAATEAAEQPAPQDVPATAAEPPANARAEGVLLEVVAEKTGYPLETLELDMKLDADLGIDSIKRVEILSAFQERLPETPSLPADEAGALQSLRDVIVAISRQSAGAAEPATPSAPAADLAADRVQDALLETIAEKTGYPIETLDLAMSLDADLGIDSIKRVEILSALQEALPEAPEIRPDEAGAFQTLRDIVEALSRETAPAAAPQATSGAASAEIQAELTRIVADKTGYPAEMLTTDMALEADLGIDSIKRVEIFSALQEAMPALPEIPADRLGEFRTLGQVVAFLERAESAEPAVAAEAPAKPAAPVEALRETLLRAVADKTGYPADMLTLDMSLEADLGIDSIKRVEILSSVAEAMPQLPELPADRVGGLRTLGEAVEAMSGAEAQPANARDAAAVPTSPSHAPVAAEPGGVQCSAPALTPLSGERDALALAEGAVVAVAGEHSPWTEQVAEAFRQRGFAVETIDLQQGDALRLPKDLAGMALLAPEAQDAVEALEAALMLAKAAGPSLQAAAERGDAFFVSATRLDGGFGLRGIDPGCDPVNAGLSGLVKTAAHEWPKVACKALDAAPDADPAKLATKIVEEALTRGPLETALTEEGVATLTRQPLQPVASSAAPLRPGDPVLVTGGARGVTAETCIALAEAFQPLLVLMGRSPLPSDSEPEWLRGLDDEAAIKKAILNNAERKLAPKELQQAYRDIVAAREIRDNLARMRAAGATVFYQSVDLRDSAATREAVRACRTRHGELRGLIHGAGVLADRRIVDKTAEQFRQVFQTKLSVASILDELTEDGLRVMAFFSSSTARFGRAGQVDYAMANEALNKLAQREALRRPDCRVVSFNWGPWDGGMVTPELKKLFAAEGIDVIPLRAGAECLVERLAATDGQAVEIVVLGAADAVEPVQAEPGSTAASAESDMHLAFTRRFDLDSHPFLRSHALNGRAVLPVAVMVEWLAHAAIHANPGLRFHGVDNLRVLKGVVLEEDQRVDLEFFVGDHRRRDGAYLAPVELRSGARVHARAEVLLGESMPEAKEKPRLAPPKGDYGRAFEDIYGSLLFHGPEFQGIARVDGCDDQGIAVAAKPAPAPKQWMRNPLRGAWLADPLALDSSFQAVILATFDAAGAPSLPAFLRAYRQYGRFSPDGCRVIARIVELGRHKAIADIEFLDAKSGALVARLDGYECVIDPSLIEAFRRNQLPVRA